MEGSMKKGWMEKVNNRVIGKFITNTILTAKITQQSNGKNCLVTPGAFYPGQLASLDHCCLEAPGQRLNNTGQNMCQCSSEPQWINHSIMLSESLQQVPKLWSLGFAKNQYRGKKVILLHKNYADFIISAFPLQIIQISLRKKKIHFN